MLNATPLAAVVALSLAACTLEIHVDGEGAARAEEGDDALGEQGAGGGGATGGGGAIGSDDAMANGGDATTGGDGAASGDAAAGYDATTDAYGATSGDAAAAGDGATGGGATSNDDGATGGDDGATASDDDATTGIDGVGPATPAVPPATTNPCGDLDAHGRCDGDVLSYCAGGAPQVVDCAGQDAVCTDGAEAAICTPRFEVVIDANAPYFWCAGATAGFYLQLAGGQVATFDEAQARVDGTYALGDTSWTFAVPGRIEGDVTGALIQFDMLLAFETANVRCDALTYANDDGFDATFDCGTESYAGGFMSESTYTLRADGTVTQHEETFIQVDTLYTTYEGIYVIMGDEIRMLLVDEDGDFHADDGVLSADGALQIPGNAQPGCTQR